MNPIPGKSRASQTGHEMKVEQESGDIICVNGDKEMFRGICVPLLQNIMVLRSKSKGSSRYWDLLVWIVSGAVNGQKIVWADVV